VGQCSDAYGLIDMIRAHNCILAFFEINSIQLSLGFRGSHRSSSCKILLYTVSCRLTFFFLYTSCGHRHHRHLGRSLRISLFLLNLLNLFLISLNPNTFLHIKHANLPHIFLNSSLVKRRFDRVDNLGNSVNILLEIIAFFEKLPGDEAVILFMDNCAFEWFNLSLVDRQLFRGTLLS
jgi:hypothetical protein